MEAEPGSPAAVAGLRPNDTIVGFKGHPIATVDDLHKQLVAAEIGVALAAHVSARNGEALLHGRAARIAAVSGAELGSEPVNNLNLTKEQNERTHQHQRSQF